jgi:hypothetical protein
MSDYVFYLISLQILVFMMCFSMQAGDEATRGSRSRMMSPEPQVVGEALADDARTASPPRGAVESRTTSPPVAAARVETPPRVVDAGGASAGDVRATTATTIIDADPISVVPGGAEDLVRD